MMEQRLELYELPEYRCRKKANNYGFDPHEQAYETCTGRSLLALSNGVRIIVIPLFDARHIRCG